MLNGKKKGKMKLGVRQSSWAYLNLLESLTGNKRTSLCVMLNRQGLSASSPDDCAEFIKKYFSKNKKG